MSDHLVIILCLLLAGYILMALEIFVVPGFGIPGLAGLACLGFGCMLAFRWLGTNHGVALVVVTLVSITAAMVWFPRSRYGSKTVHTETLAGASSGDTTLTIGAIGVAESDLRPVGIARFGELRESVVTDGEYINSGTKVAVVSIDGARIIVETATT